MVGSRQGRGVPQRRLRELERAGRRVGHGAGVAAQLGRLCGGTSGRRAGWRLVDIGIAGSASELEAVSPPCT